MHCCHSDYGPELSEAARHTFFTSAELQETSVYHDLRPAFGSGAQFPAVPDRSFSPQYDYAGRVTLRLNLQPMLEPTLIEPNVVRPRLSVCASMDLHALTPSESVSIFSAFLQNGYEVQCCILDPQRQDCYRF
jgi:hypothetical protein